jgi:hypothetical protein
VTPVVLAEAWTLADLFWQPLTWVAECSRSDGCSTAARRLGGGGGVELGAAKAIDDDDEAVVVWVWHLFIPQPLG